MNQTPSQNPDSTRGAKQKSPSNRRAFAYIFVMILAIGVLKGWLVILGPKLTHDPTPSDIPVFIFAILSTVVLLVGVIRWIAGPSSSAD